jgi:GTPase SAR1 family protein
MTYIPESLKGYFATMQALSKIKIPSQEVNADMINLTRGKRLRALGIVLYGPEGIGKTTLASQFPSPVFIDLESGSDTLDVVRVDPPDSFDELLTLMDELKHEDFKTVVIDTADKLEQLITAHVLAEHDLKSI